MAVYRRLEPVIALSQRHWLVDPIRWHAAMIDLLMIDLLLKRGALATYCVPRLSGKWTRSRTYQGVKMEILA